MSRETLKLTDEQLKLLPREKIEGFDFVQEEKVYFDSEKGYVDIEIIIKRLHDNKFFKGTYSNWGHSNIEWESSIFDEVFPQQKTVITYV